MSYTGDLYQNIKARADQGSVFADLGGEELTYRQLLDSTGRLVTFFRARKLKGGSRIIIISRSDREAIKIFVAALLEGITPVMLPADTRSDRAEAIAGKVSPALVFIDDDISEGLSWLDRERTLLIKPEEKGGSTLLGRFLKKGGAEPSRYQGIFGNDPTEPSCHSEPEASALISFSSGTTSAPKGIVLTHKNLFEHLATLVRVYGHSDGSRIFNNLSLAHADGMVQGPLLALYCGGLLYRPESFTVQNLERLLNSVYGKRITHFITVPTVISLIDHLTTNDDYFEGEDFRSLISVAAKLDKNLWQRSEERFGIRICNMYGLTETVSGGIFCGPGDELFEVGTVGKPVDVEIKVVDEEGGALPPGADGELWMKGENVTPGYLDDPDGTAELFSGPWLRTGDMARIRNDGFVEIVGRIKAIIVSGGFNIHPDEIDEVLMKHPLVTSSATVGIADDDWGELVVCAVTVASPAGEAELINHCREYLEATKVPKKIALVEELPRGVSGKVILAEVREFFTGTELASTTRSGAFDRSDVVELAASVFKVEPDTLSFKSSPDTIEGWDSLGHLELITAAEQRYSIEFGMDEMMSVDSLGRLFDIVSAKTGEA